MAEIHRECFPHYWDGEAFTNFLLVNNTFGVVAVGDEPMGMVVFRVQYEQADIITLAVRPGWRRRGVAADLLVQALKKSKAAGAEKMFLEVEDNNEAALALYKRFGFTQIKRRKLYYRQKDGSYTDALVMTCKLA